MGMLDVVSLDLERKATEASPQATPMLATVEVRPGANANPAASGQPPFESSVGSRQRCRPLNVIHATIWRRHDMPNDGGSISAVLQVVKPPFDTRG